MEKFINTNNTLPMLLIIGIIVVVSFFAGRAVKKLKLPSILGYMLAGIVFGPSFLNLLPEKSLDILVFIPQIVLGFVALSIGLQLNFAELREKGVGLIITIFAESFGAFLVVFLLLYLFTHDIPLSLIFASIAPASAPAGTVAVIQEYKAKGKLTQALYAVVGFDDGLGILIFGIAAAIAKFILMGKASQGGYLNVLIIPIKEILLSIALGTIAALIFSIVGARRKYANYIFVFIFGFVLLIAGICEKMHLSLILANLIFGIVICNFHNKIFIKKVDQELCNILPLFFILFFTLAGANLHVSVLSSLGFIGLVYILGRTIGLVGGAYVGAAIGQLETKIRKYLGLGILSQAGVAIGLSMIVKNDFHGLGPILPSGVHAGDQLASTVLTTITATCIFFEILGPITTKIALTKSGEATIGLLNAQKEYRVDAKGLTQKHRLKFYKNFIKSRLNLLSFNSVNKKNITGANIGIQSCKKTAKK